MGGWGGERHLSVLVSLDSGWSPLGLRLGKGLHGTGNNCGQLGRQWQQRKCLICERQPGPAVNYSLVFLLLFF